MKHFLTIAMVALVSVFCQNSVQALVTYGQGIGDEAFNTNGSASLVSSVWDKVGIMTYPVGGSVGNATTATIIGPHQIITANHVSGQIGDIFTLNGVSYSVTSITPLGDGVTSATVDIAVLTVNGTFTDWVPLYDKNDEVGKQIAYIGTGRIKSTELSLNGTPFGWDTQHPSGNNPYGAIKRWGTNNVSQIDTFRYYGNIDAEFLTNFDADGGANEFQLASGDSGGAGFINDNGTWKLAGVGVAVSGYYSRVGNDSDKFLGAIYDARGLYIQNDSGGYDYIDPLTHPFPVTSQSYIARISQSALVINSLIPEPSTLALFTLGVFTLVTKRKKRA
jgi:hypothetical protein